MFGRKGVSISRTCLWYKLAFILEKVKEKALRGNWELINNKWFINSEELWVKFGHLCILENKIWSSMHPIFSLEQSRFTPTNYIFEEQIRI